MSYIWRSKRRREPKPNTTFVVHHMGRPVVAAGDAAAARAFVYSNADKPETHTVGWTRTGKFLVEGRFTGWEMREVQTL
ncbi:hypothetical protein [Streptomyces roseolus]|uniref:hypothetical protein n=1 Tax=Streptomyces roseolus TaxID=67358 RepID=UPI0016776A46|nr:hypothetical protein [Streptomyces roseolus]GGR51476.1 hypothetical protein GCM10010282_50480 [Streptomyces roseolus]